MYQVSSFQSLVSSIESQGASKKVREQVIAIWNFLVLLLFFTRAIPRGARAPKNDKNSKNPKYSANNIPVPKKIRGNFLFTKCSTVQKMKISEHKILRSKLIPCRKEKIYQNPTINIKLPKKDIQSKILKICLYGNLYILDEFCIS